MLTSQRYDAWNSVLLDRFFSPRYRGAPVYLAVDDEEIAELGERLDIIFDPVSDLSRAVRDRLLSGAGINGFVRLVPTWRQRADVPPYLAFLALTVLAASRMAADPEKGLFSNDYYARLNELLHRETFGGMPPSFERTHVLWEDLATWLDQDLNGERGHSTIRRHPHLVNVGWPMSQCVLRASDRARLPDFFRFAGLEPREKASGQRLLSLFRIWARPNCGLSIIGLRAAAAASVAMQEQLGDVLATELSSWDGELRDAHGGRRAEVLLLAERRAGGRRVELSFYARRPDGFPAGTFTAEGGPPVELRAGQNGWYQRLTTEPTSARLAASFRLRNGDFSVAFTPESVIPFREAFQPTSGWLEARQVVPFEPHIVLFHQSAETAVRAFASRWAESGWRGRSPAGLPASWLMIEGLRIHQVPSSVPPELLRLAPRLVSSLSLVGGLQVVARTFLTGGEPDVQVTIDEAASPIVELDGFEQLFGTGAIELKLADNDLLAGEHVLKAGGQTRTFVSIDGLGATRPDSAGTMALKLSRHKTYVPASAEAEPVGGEPPTGTVWVAGASVVAAPEDLPLSPPRPIMLRRSFLRWELIGSEVGEVHDGGRPPLRPSWLSSIPGSPSCQYFECYPPFAPEFVIYTGRGGIVVRALVIELASPRGAPSTVAEAERQWTDVVLRAHASHATIEPKACSVWAEYVALAMAWQA